ncbi:serine hydrolase [Paraflavitalea pollutisoli]|uniref:serine hydrolase n=1 Tax=Paraflavitalea pollutisoli TaxID=3034143 RepID=UPI0023EB982B|nr:serine hydrolase [Paraflavitalea sp. H1-2-19X]
MKIVRAALLLLFSVANDTGFAQPRSDKAIERSLDSALQANFQPNEPGIVVLAARQGKIIYQKAYGSANIELGVPLQPDMVFRIASVSKQFTAIGILQLMELGKLRLSDSIRQYLPDFPYKGATITIEHLLTHTSGIPDFMGIDHPDRYIERHDLTLQLIIDHFKNAPLQFKPGTRYAYSNSGYTLLAAIIEKVSGQPFHQYMRKAVLDKAGLQRTYYEHEMTVIPGRVAGYTRDKGYYQNTYFQSISLGYGCGDLLSTVGDLYKWHQALYAYKLVSKQTLEKAQSSYTLPDGNPTGYGYGWIITTKFGMPYIKHEGQVSGFISLEGYLPGQDIFVAALTNLKSGEDRTDFSSRRFMLLNALPELVAGTPVQELTLSKEEMAGYTGKYKMANGNNRLEVIVKDGRLFLQQGMPFRMQPITQRKFFVPDIPGDATVEFVLDASGKSTGLLVWQGGVKYDWLRVD